MASSGLSFVNFTYCAKLPNHTLLPTPHSPPDPSRSLAAAIMSHAVLAPSSHLVKIIHIVSRQYVAAKKGNSQRGAKTEALKVGIDSLMKRSLSDLKEVVIGAGGSRTFCTLVSVLVTLFASTSFSNVNFNASHYVFSSIIDLHSRFNHHSFRSYLPHRQIDSILWMYGA